MTSASKKNTLESERLSWLRLGAPPRSAEIDALFTAQIEAGDAIRNSQQVFAHGPARFLAFSAYGNAVMASLESRLSEREREIVALAVSAFNRCTVCIVSHAAELRRIVDDPVFVATLAYNPQHAALAPRERALVDYARKLTESPADIVEADLTPLRKAGLEETTILEAAHLVAYYNLSNRLMTGLGVRPTASAYFAHRDKGADVAQR